MAKYRVGIIGSTGHGDYGHGIDTVWKDIPDIEVVAIADENDSGRAKALERTGAKNGYADYGEMLDKEHFNIVAIGTRWVDRHADMVLAAIDHGCHVYMEKPFCRTLIEADKIVEAVERKHVKLAIAHQTRYSPIMPIAKRMIDEGKLGQILEVRARGKEDQRGGTEDLWVLGSHVLDLMRYFGGDATSCYATLSKQGRPVMKADVVVGNEGLGPLAGDGVNAMFTLSGGATGYFGSHRGQGGGKGRFGIQIFGSKGILEVLTGYLPSVKFLPDPSWSPARSGIAWVNVSSNGAEKPESLKDTGLHGGNISAVKHLIQCIETDAKPLCGVYEGRAIVEMIMSIFESHRLQAPVSLPLKERGHPLNQLA
ncbi:MAG: oxidoreductase domain protein [Planctomycetaceae bacterium]|nr:oxidoreductase domain protein [Planctomycetaceae bacterium]